MAVFTWPRAAWAGRQRSEDWWYVLPYSQCTEWCIDALDSHDTAVPGLCYHDLHFSEVAINGLLGMAILTERETHQAHQPLSWPLMREWDCKITVQVSE